MKNKGRPPGFDRTEVLAKAMQVFWRKGFLASSMNDLVAAMGIQSASIYAAFGSKEALFREAMQHYSEQVGQPIWDSLSRKPVRDAIEAALATSVVNMTSPEHPTGCLITLGGLEGGMDATLLAELNKLRSRLELALRARLRQAIADQEVSPDADLDAIAAFYAAVQQAIALRARSGATKEQLNSLVQTAMRAWPALAAP